MGKILTEHEAIITAKGLKSAGKTIVLAGGCFDVLHYGHEVFLKKAKEKGDALFVLLEDDKSVKTRKGNGRPVNSQKQRAEALSNINDVDYIVLLENVKKDEDYDKMMRDLVPDTIATTKGDPNVHHKKRQAKQTGARVEFVTERMKDYSTTRILKDSSKKIT